MFYDRNSGTGLFRSPQVAVTVHVGDDSHPSIVIPANAGIKKSRLSTYARLIFFLDSGFRRKDGFGRQLVPTNSEQFQVVYRI